MSMPGLPELVALAILALLIFGPDRLPDIVRNVGKAVGTLRREARNAVNDFKTASDYQKVRDAARELRGETDALRQEGREAGQALRGAVDDPPASRAARRDGAEAGPPAQGSGDRERSEPPPFDADAP